jgi:hypothetical protein
MPVTVSSEIQASQYNNLRNTVNSILNTNYGQLLLSTVAQVNDVLFPVSSLKKRELFLDIQKTHVHHTGNINTDIAIPPSSVTIAADISQNYNQSTGALSALTDGAKMGYNDYELAVNTLSNFNPSTANIWPVGNFTLGTATSSSRATTWGGASQVQSIYHIVTFTFASSTARNQYFNAGGELRFSAGITGGTGSKSTDWTNLLNAIGTIRFSKWRLTASSGTSNPAGSGFDSLSDTYRVIYTKAGSGVYVENQYTIEARIESTTTLRFRIRFDDIDAGDPTSDFPLEGIDESVNGTISSIANTFRPDSSFVFNSQPVTAVSLPAPAMSTVVALTANNSTPPA